MKNSQYKHGHHELLTVFNPFQKPIDITLTDLGSKGLLPELDKISSIVKSVMEKTKLSNNKLENAAFDYWEKNQHKYTININSLTNELAAILKDSDYLLIHKGVNGRNGTGPGYIISSLL